MTRDLTRRIAIACLLFGGGVFVGYVATGSETSTDAPFPFTDGLRDIRERSGDYHFISPLLGCDADFATTSPTITLTYRALTSTLDRIREASGIQTLAVYVRDFDNGPWFGYHEDIDFAPASLIKVPIMMAVFKKAEREPNILSERVRTPAKDAIMEGVQVDDTTPVKPDTEYTLEELIRYMLTDSDNLAAQTLIDYVTMDKVDEVFIHIGVPLDLHEGDQFLTVREYASFFRVLYNASFLTREYSERALGMLAESNFEYGIIRGVPEGTQVAHKWGIRSHMTETGSDEQVHDCGIVYYPGHPYLLCVMTRGSDPARQADVIKVVSETIYDEVSRSLKQQK